MLNIVAIGGGDFSEPTAWSVDEQIVRLTGRKRPRALFIPTASGDDRAYAASFDQIYGVELGCRTETLYLLSEAPSLAELRRRIAAADLIYVGGGNTLMMMRRWRRLGVDRLLLAAARRGTVLAGVSAGANCWFAWGCSDSMAYYHPDDWDYIRVRGLRLIDAYACPHYHKERREQAFAAMIAAHGGVGIAIDDLAALAVRGDKYRVLHGSSDAPVYRLIRERGEVIAAELDAEHWRPLRELHLKSP